MSLTSEVPATVPSVFHSSLPVEDMSPPKYTEPPKRVGYQNCPDQNPSRSRRVPDSVPSLVHSPLLDDSCAAPKTSLPPTSAMGTGELHSPRGWPSPTAWVPSIVPSD